VAIASKSQIWVMLDPERSKHVSSHVFLRGSEYVECYHPREVLKYALSKVFER